MSYQLTIPLALGTSQTGLSLEAQLISTAGANVGSAITTGFVEVGAGQYLWTGAIPDGHTGGIKFQVAGGGALKASTAINPQEAENSDTKTSTRSNHTPADVWAVGGRTLTGFGTLVADITAAVWGAATRTLSAIGFPVTAGTVLDKTGYSLASAPPSAQAIRDAVLDAAVSAHNTPGSVGASLIAAGSAGDPWAALLPGNYISGQAGYTIGHNLDVPTGTRAPAGTLVTSIGPVLDGGTIQIVAGDTYQSERGTAIVRQYGGPVDLLTNPAPVITLEISAALIVLSVPVMASGTPGAIMLTAELSAAQSRLLRSKGSRFNYAYRAIWADVDTDRVTVMTGVFNVSAER